MAAKTKPRAKPAARKPRVSKKTAPPAQAPDLVAAMAEDVPGMLEPEPRKKGFWARLFGL